MRKTSFYHIVVISLLATCGVLLMLWQMPYPGAPWLKIDLSDVPVLIGGFAFGPLAGIFILLLKNVLFFVLKFHPIELIGVPMNIISTAVLVVVSSSIYHRNKTWSNALVGLFSGMVASIVVMIFMNYWIMPHFIKWFMPHMPLPSSEKLTETVIFVVVPFNFVKDALNGALTFLLYKRVSLFIKGATVQTAKVVD